MFVFQLTGGGGGGGISVLDGVSGCWRKFVIAADAGS